MGKIKDLTNQHFGKLTVLYDTGVRKNRQVVWHCKCDCGKECDVVGQALRTGHTKSCGCLNYEKKVEDLVGKTFYDLIVLERHGSDKRRNALWLCQCKCGNHRTVTTNELKSGAVKACRECSIKISHKGHPYYGNGKYEDSKWYQSIIDHKFGKLKPIEPTDKRDNAGRVIWKCKCDCGNPNFIYISSSSFKNGNTLSCGCLKKHSAGEEIIANILNEKEIKYQREYTFDNLMSPKQTPLRFDFAIFKNNQLQLLIEFDGIQHFEPIERFGGEKSFKYQLECDNIKNNYCKKNNLKLKRIKYTEKNDLENIILNLIKELQL